MLIVWVDMIDKNHYLVAGMNFHWLSVGMHSHWEFDTVHQRTFGMWLH